MPYTLRPTSTITVNVQRDGVDPGTWGQWEVVASGPVFDGTDFTEAGVGDATLGATVDIVEGRQYEIEFYQEAGYATPSATPITADATSQEFFGDYLSSSGTRVAVTIVNAPQDTRWTLTGPSYPGGFTGTGDMSPAQVDPGSYTITWGWQQYYKTPVPYPWQETKTVTADTVTTFNTPYTPRSALEHAAIPIGTGLRGGTYYGSVFQPSNILVGSDQFKPTPTSIDANGWPITIPSSVDSIAAVHANGKFGLQTFWMFWKGHGTVRVLGENSSGLRTDTELLASQGEEGVSFTLWVKTPVGEIDPENFVEEVNSNATFRIISTDGADHLRDVEIVHEDSIPVPVEKDFRKVGPGNTYLNADMPRMYEQYSCFRLMDHFDDIRYVNPAEDNGDEGDRQGWDYEGLGRTMDSPAFKSWSTVRHSRQVQIDMCNAAGKDYWCCLSPWDNDAHLDDIIDQIEAPYTGYAGGGLRTDLKVYLEYGNENWNNTYATYYYARYWGLWHAGNWVDQWGRPFPGRTQGVRATPTQGFADINYTNPTNCERRYTSYRTWKSAVAYAANTTFAAKVSSGEYSVLSDRVKVVCPGFAAGGNLEFVRFSEDTWPTYDQPEISFDGANNFSTFVDVYSPQLYTSIDSNLGGGGHGDVAPWPPDRADWEWRAEQYFDNWQQWQIDEEWPLLEARSELATKYGLDMMAYEAGQHVTATALDGDFLYYIQNHPRIYDIQKRQFDKWKELGGLMPVNFTGVARWKPDGGADFWGIRESYYTADDRSYRWMAQVDWAFDNPLEPGGPPPVPADTETIAVVVDSPAGASWSISPDPGGTNGSGTTSKSFQALLDDYTITWNDTAISSSVNTPDASNGPITLTVGNPITWTASDFYTTLATGEVHVDIQKDLGAEDGTEEWTIAGDDPFDETDFFETGTGDTPAGGATGPFYHARDYVVSYSSEGASWETPSPDVVTVDSVTPQTATGNYNPTSPPPTVGVPHDIYWIGHSLTQKNMVDAFHSIASDLGFQTVRPDRGVTEEITPGASLQWHWCPDPQNNPTCAVENSLSRQAMATGDWDTLIMTEQTPLPNSTASSVEYANRYLDLARTHAPGINVFMWETWENRTGVTTWPDPAWRANLLSEASNWQAITDGVNDAQSGTDMIRIRGGSLFWVDLYDELLADNITGFDKLHEFFKPNDTIHCNDYGWYFCGLIVTAILFQTAVTGASNQIYSRYGNPWPASSTLTTTQAAELQAIVDGITGYT